MARRGTCPIAGIMCCAADPGGPIRAMCVQRVANIMIRGSAMSPTASAWRVPSSRTRGVLTRRIVLSSALQLLPVVAIAGKTPAPKDAYLYIIWPNDGERIKGPFWCRFGLRNMGVTHADDATPKMGHHHLLIDVDEPLDPDAEIPSNKNHLHFGAGQTEAR